MRATRVLWLVVVVGARTIDPTGLETLAFGACTPPPAVGSARDLRVCFENGVRVKLGSSELDLSMGAEGSPDGLVAYNRTSGRVVWRCTNEGRCIVGEGTPTRAPATGVIIMGEAATGQIGLWQVHSDTLAELDGLLVRLQAVSVHGLRGVRVEHDGERSFVLLESGQVGQRKVARSGKKSFPCFFFSYFNMASARKKKCNNPRHQIVLFFITL